MLLPLALLPFLLAVGCFDRFLDSARTDRTGKQKSGKRSPAPESPRRDLTANRFDDPAPPPDGVGKNGNDPGFNAGDQPPPVVNLQPPIDNRPPPNLPPIRLAVGTALPQSLPGGTRMFFSAEYQFTSGGPKSGVHYVWVIEGRGGKKVRAILSRLASRGQLPAGVSPFRPDDGPFQCYIEEWQRSSRRLKPGSGKRVSNTIPLR